MAYVFCFMSQDFYDRHADEAEIEKKLSRPYLRLLVTVNAINLAVPFRSNLSHKYVLYTNKEKRRGLDFSKAVVVRDESKDIDVLKHPHIRDEEFDALRGKEHIIEQFMLRYIRAYAKAKSTPDVRRNKALLDYSTLQYFPEEEAALVSAISTNVAIIIKVLSQ